MLALCATIAHADDTRVHELERNLRERDKVIMELLDRVEALEQRVGVRRASAGSAGAGAGGAGAGGAGAGGAGAGGAGAAIGTATAASRAPGAVVADRASAERALERSLTRQGALLLPAGVLEIEPGLSYTRREDAAPTLVTSNGALFAGEVRRNVDSLGADFGLRLGLPWDSQLEIGIPYSRHRIGSVSTLGFEPTASSALSASGLGDVRLGFAKTLVREGLWRPDLVGRLTWDTRTGSTRNGVSLGSGFHELSASLTAIKRHDPVAFIGGLSYRHAFERDQVRPGSAISANFGAAVALSPETSLQFALGAAHQRGTEFSGRGVAGTSRTVGTFTVGGSTLLGRGVLLNVSAGIGLTRDADDFSIMVSLPIRLDKALF
jgi:hypothetical protein